MIEYKKRPIYLHMLLLALSITIFLSCSKDDTSVNPGTGDEPESPPAPHFLSATPASDTSVFLSWFNNGFDVTRFFIYRDQADSFILIDSTVVSTRNYTDYGLEESTAYSYFVRSTDGVTLSETSDTVTTTTYSSNTPPGIPHNPVPADSAVNQSIALELTWTCYDPNDGDTLTYNLYLADAVDSIPPVTALGRTESSYYIEDLLYEMLYEWQVVAYDNHGDSTIGSVWTFTTGTAP